MRTVLVLVALAICTPALADKADLSTMTCKAFLASDKDDMKITLAWLDAYYKGENDPPVIDTDKLVSNAKKLGEFCSANPELGLITATDKLFGK